MITIDNQKQCSKCKEWQPATNEFFGNKKSGPFGLRSQCKRCQHENNRKWYEANQERNKENCRKWYESNKEQAKEKNRKWREANPKLAKELSRKWREANPKHVKEYSRKWREANPELAKENNRKWREANPEQAKELARKWREANPELAKELARKWDKANPEKAKERGRKWDKENPEKKKEKIRNWREKNPEKLAEYGQKRRALKANADGTSDAEQIKARFQYHENRCYYCGDSESGLHVEHRIPLSRGGSNWPSNLVPACPSCNLSKHTKTEKEFINQ